MSVLQPPSYFRTENRRVRARSISFLPHPPTGSPPPASPGLRMGTVARTPHSDFRSESKCATPRVDASIRQRAPRRSECCPLPAAGGGRGLVSNSALYRQRGGGQPSLSPPGGKLRNSLPSTRAQNGEGLCCHVTSASHKAVTNDSCRAPQPPSLPRINNLVTKRAIHTTQPAQAQNMQKHGQGAAGISTREHDVQPLTSSKFASSWANARVDHIRERAVLVRRSKSEPCDTKLADPTKVRKDYPRPWLIKMMAGPSEQNKDGPVSKDGRRQPFPATDQNWVTTKASKDSKMPADDKSANPKPALARRNNVIYVAPRRERTRLRIQRAKTKAILDAKWLADDIESGKGGKPRGYCNADAVNIYYANAAVGVMSTGSRQLFSKDAGMNKKSTVEEEDEEGRGKRGGKDTVSEQQREQTTKPKEYILNRRESEMYTHIRHVYDTDAERYRNQREHRFYRRVEQVQLESWRRQQADRRRRRMRAQLARRCQQQQLKRLRDRFSEEQERRFRCQYVTGKVLEEEHGWNTSNIYGLPDGVELEAEVRVGVKTKTRRPEAVFDRSDRRYQNWLKFKRIFSVNRGPSWHARARTPKMEGIDTVVIGDGDKGGKGTGRRLEVKDVVLDALQLLEEETTSSGMGSPRKTDGRKLATNQGTAIKNSNQKNKSLTMTPSTTTQAIQPKDFLSLKPTDKEWLDTDSLALSDTGDPDEDIFEKARRKYNIVFDSDEEL